MPKPKLNLDQQQRVVELHTDEHVGTEELGELYGVSQTTIWRILRRFAAVGRPMCSKVEQKIILRMSKQRRTREQIALFLGRSRGFVAIWQRRLDCQRKHEPTQQDKETIIRLYRDQKKGQARIAKITGVPQLKVRRTLLEAGIPIHRPGDRRFQMAPKELRKFRADVLSRKYFCVDLARKYGLSKSISLRLAKEILGTPIFFRGETYPPLSSVFPERHQTWTAADYVRILATIFPDGLPSQPDYVVVPTVVSVLLETFPFWRSAGRPVLQNLENHLVTALGTMRGAEGALVN